MGVGSFEELDPAPRFRHSSPGCTGHLSRCTRGPGTTRRPATVQGPLLSCRTLPSSQHGSARTPVERLLSSWKETFCTSMLVGGTLSRDSAEKLSLELFSTTNGEMAATSTRRKKTCRLAQPSKVNRMILPSCPSKGGPYRSSPSSYYYTK